MAYTHRDNPPAGPVLVYANDRLGLWSKMQITPKPPGTFLQYITGRYRNQKEHSGSRESGQTTSTSSRMARCKIARCKLPYAGRFILARARPCCSKFLLSCGLEKHIKIAGTRLEWDRIYWIQYCTPKPAGF